MKQKIILFLIAAAFSSILAGCNSNAAPSVSPSSETDIALLKVFDVSIEAEAYTSQLFTSMLSEKNISQYEILLTSGGFITSDPLVFISGYQYAYDGKEAVYGYKLRLNDDGVSFTVLEEGPEAGEFVCLNESPSTEG